MTDPDRSERLRRQDELSNILARHRGRLLALDGVTAVAVGLKHRGGRPSEELCIVVFVTRKLPDVPAGQCVPPDIDGVPTDVVERTFRLTQTLDPSRRQQVLSPGLAIAPMDAPDATGSIGCFIRTAGRAVPAIAPGTYLLTNQHVIFPRGPADEVIQPDWFQLSAPPVDYLCGVYQIGFRDGNHDCAIAAIAGGRGSENTVPNPQGGFSLIDATAAPAVGDLVFKFGARTLTTIGRVTNIAWTNAGQHEPEELEIVEAVYIESVDPGKPWIGAGDSGSVVVIATAANRATAVVLHSLGDTTRPFGDPQDKLYMAGIGFPIRSQMARFADGGQVRLARPPQAVAHLLSAAEDAAGEVDASGLADTAGVAEATEGTVATGAEVATGERHSELVVEAIVRWVDTGLDVAAGSTITVTYLEGQWTANPATGMVDAEGNPAYVAKSGYALEGHLEGLLVGQVGDAVFPISRGATVPAGLTGRLRLSINDDLDGTYGSGFYDNDGSVLVRISVGASAST